MLPLGSNAREDSRTCLASGSGMAVKNGKWPKSKSLQQSTVEISIFQERETSLKSVKMAATFSISLHAFLHIILQVFPFFPLRTFGNEKEISTLLRRAVFTNQLPDTASDHFHFEHTQQPVHSSSRAFASAHVGTHMLPPASCAQRKLLLVSKAKA